MQLQNTMRYFNEYLFHQQVNALNERRKEAGEPVLLCSEARELHKAFCSALASQKSSIDKAGRQTFCACMNQVFADVNGGKPLFDGADGVAQYNQYVKGFQQFTGMARSDGTTVRVRQEMLPLSPFDERFMNRSVFRKNGSSLLFALGKDVDMFAESFDENVNLYRMQNNSLRKAGSALTKSDMSGLSVLMPYISQKDYTAVEEWVNRVGDVMKTDEFGNSYLATDESKFMTPAALERSVAVLQALQSEGTPYTIECDEKPGQIRAKLTGTKISVRLMDERSRERYIGRVYDDGIAIYYTTDKILPGTGKPGEKKPYAPYQNVTPKDAVRLLHFAQGKSVSRNDMNEPAGKVRTYSKQMRSSRNGNMTWKNEQYNESYHSGKEYSAAVAAYPGDSQSRVFIHVNSDRSMPSKIFKDGTSAEQFLRSAVLSARENFQRAMDVDMLVAEAAAHRDDDTYMPPFSGDAGIAAIQRNYWDVLVGKRDTLLAPGTDVDDYEEQLDELSDFGLAGSAVEQFLKSDVTYTGTPEEMVRKHLLDNTDYLIGQFDKDEDGRRFNPVSVASNMDSEYGRYRNNDDIVAALRAMHMNADELKGSDFYNKTVKDKLIQFDKATARPMSTITNSFVQNMYHEIRTTISESGALVNDRDIEMDANGIVHYKATLVDVKKVRPNGPVGREVNGEIGQLFIPDGLGLVETKFAGTDNYLFSPGYEAYVVPQKSGENKSLEERTRLRGYEQIMADAIRYRIRSDLMMNTMNVGSPTSVNSVYRRLYDERYPLDYMAQARLDGMSDDVMKAILETNARRVRYGNEYRDNSTINAEYQGRIQEDDFDETNDNFMDYYQMTGRRNMSIITKDRDGYFDPDATSTSTNQGLCCYLVESATVNPDGSITPGDKNDRTPLMKHPMNRYMDYIPFDRRQMMVSNELKMSCLATGVKTAQMTFGGYTFDDGYVVSKEFAEQYRIRNKHLDENGLPVRRSLKVGDKICDMNGNKGVISLIVDRNMTDAEIHAKAKGNSKKEQSLKNARDWFAANPELQVVGAPFPPVSRFNGGSARELMEVPQNLMGPDGQVHEGCMGEATYVITHMAVDEKTHIYGEDELAQGKGRKASAQLAWALASQGCVEVLKECYGSNNGATSNLREMLIAMGLDMDETGTFRVGYQPHAGEERQLFSMTDLEYKSGDVPKLDVASMKKKFNNVISQAGGFLEVPFQLSFPNTKGMPEVPADRRYDPNEKSFMMPVLSAYLRSGQEFEDGTSTVHDYTNHYLRIYESACKYRDAKASGDRNAMSREHAIAQAEYNKITKDLETRKFSGKHNVFRDNIMGNRMPKSATAVWTADPTLDIDQIAIGPEMAKNLDVKDNQYILTWRDPVLRDGGVRYLRVVIDEELVGVAINPMMDKSYDGDFDGDSIGLLNLQTKAARQEAYEKLAMEANLLEYGQVNADGTYPLFMQDGLDLKSAAYANPDLAAWRSDIEAEANEIEDRKANMTPKELRQARKELVSGLSSYSTEAFENEYGTDMISWKDMPSHIKSVEQMVIHGSKGSYSKLEDYAKYLGCTYERVPGNIDPREPIVRESIQDLGRTQATREDSMATQYATAVKSFGTGIAGMVSQRGVATLRNHCAKAVLELTYPVTQSILQSKHDPVEARRKYEMLMSTGRDLWRGYKMQKQTVGDGDDFKTVWNRVTDDKGQPVQASVSEWEQQFVDIYTSPQGLNVKINPMYVAEVAKNLDDGHGKMLNIETDGKLQKGAILDRLAYGGTFETLCEAAAEHRNLYEGKFTQYFAPSSIRRNQAAMQDDSSDHVLKAIVKSDVCAEKPSLKSVSPTEPVVRDGSELREMRTEETSDDLVFV